MRIKHSKIAGLAALGLTVALVAGACGGNGDAAAPTPDASPTDEAPTPEPDPTEDAPPTRADADLVIWTDDVRAGALTDAAVAWGEANGLTVAVQAISGPLQDLFITADSLGNGPDLVIGAHDWVGNLVQNGSIVPVVVPDTSDFVPEAIAAATFQGQLFGVPYATETIGLFANNALTADPAPATMEALVAAAEAGVDGNVADNVLCLQIGNAGDPFHMQPLFTSGGGAIFGMNDDGTWNGSDVQVGSDGSVAAAEKIGALGAAGVLSTSIDGSNSIPLFADGNCAYLVSGPWALAQIAAIDYSLAAIPPFADGGPALAPGGVQMFFVAANGANQAMAQAFVGDIATGTDVTAAMFAIDHRPPAQMSLADKVAGEFPDLATFGQLFANAQPMPAIPQMSAVWGPLGQAQAQIVDGADPASTIKGAAEAIVTAIGG